MKLKTLVLLSAMFMMSITVVAKENPAKDVSFEGKFRVFLGLNEGYYSELLKNEKKTKKAMEVFRKYFTEEDMDAVNAFWSSSVGKKMLGNEMRQFAEAVTDLMYYNEQPLKNKLPKQSKVSNDTSVFNRCEVDFRRNIENILAGIERYKRNCNVSTFPDSLDYAQDGRANADNPFFTKVTDYPATYHTWSKKGNAYTFICEEKGKIRNFIFKYDPKDGTVTSK